MTEIEYRANSKGDTNQENDLFLGPRVPNIIVPVILPSCIRQGFVYTAYNNELSTKFMKEQN